MLFNRVIGRNGKQMTDKQRIEQDINDAQAKLNDAQERLKRLDDNGGRWKPPTRQGYWAISEQGRVFETFWDDDKTDFARYAYNNVFKTKEQAEYARGLIKDMNLCKPPFAVGDKYYHVENGIGAGAASWNNYDWQINCWHLGKIAKAK